MAELKLEDLPACPVETTLALIGGVRPAYGLV